MDVPSWLLNGRIIGEDNLGALLAVGLSDGVPWTARRWHNGLWLSYRPATREEIGMYDELVLKELHVSLED